MPHTNPDFWQNLPFISMVAGGAGARVPKMNVTRVVEAVIISAITAIITVSSTLMIGQRVLENELSHVKDQLQEQKLTMKVMRSTLVNLQVQVAAQSAYGQANHEKHD